jgi:hypothetical protein
MALNPNIRIKRVYLKTSTKTRQENFKIGIFVKENKVTKVIQKQDFPIVNSILTIGVLSST